MGLQKEGGQGQSQETSTGAKTSTPDRQPPIPGIQSIAKNQPVDATKTAPVGKESAEHLKFVVELYKDQTAAGRAFLHESPTGSASWNVPQVVQLRDQKGVYTVVADQCMFGAAARTGGRRTPQPVRRSTGYLTNSYHSE